MFANWSLKNKAIAFSCAIGVLPMLALGVASYTATDRHIVKQTIEDQQYRGFSIGDKINRFLFERYGDIEIIANQPILNDQRVIVSQSKDEREKTLKRFITTYGVYDNIAVFDLNGNPSLVSGSNTLNGKNQKSFAQALQTGKPTIEALISPETNSEVIYFSKIVNDLETNKVKGVARSRMQISIIQDLLKDFNNSGDSWYLIDNSTGKIIAGADAKSVGQSPQAIYPELGNTNFSSDKLFSRITRSKDNREVLLSYGPVTEYKGLFDLNWSLVLTRPTQRVFATQHTLLWALVGGTTVTAFVVGGIAIFFSSRTTNFIKEVASAISASANEIAATVQQQEQTVNLQASAVNETTVTMDELGVGSRQSAEQAEASSLGARQALALAEEGSRAVQETMQGMNGLKLKVEAIAERIIHLSEQTTQIGSISDLVSNLANQTNMLALNAAVEAARAGEHGKGFGVVASEIRKLADQSKQSAEKINVLVSDIQSSINSTVMVTDEGTKTVDSNLALSQSSAERFSGVADAVNSVFMNSQQISLSAKQQAVAIQQAVSAMNEINLGAQETATGINQVRVTTQELNEAAHKLSALV